MQPDEIKVTAYSGYKSNQYPKRFQYKGCSYEVLEVEKEWVESHTDGRNKKYCFKVRANIGSCTISYNPKSNVWFLEQVKG